MYTISKEFNFSASHCLDHLSQSHPCASTHGHNYTVVVELSGSKLNDVGMVMDYHDLAPIKEWIDKTVDHKHLNDVFSFPPTAENMAEHFYHRFKMVLSSASISAVTVKETDKTAARYAPSAKG